MQIFILFAHCFNNKSKSKSKSCWSWQKSKPAQ